jgi:hypothetical protein
MKLWKALAPLLPLLIASNACCSGGGVRRNLPRPTLKNLPEIVVAAAEIRDGAVFPSSSEDGHAIRSLEGEVIYLIGPVESFEAIEIKKIQHFRELHLNPTWSGDWPDWLEPVTE